MQDKDREILIELKTDMGWVKTMLSNHLLHHKRATYLLLTFIGGLVVTLGGMVVTLILALV